MPLTFHPRNDFVLIRIEEVGQTPSGIAIPQISVEGKKFLIEATGPDVEDLEVGDSVLMTGELGKDYSFLPGRNDLLVIRQGNVVLVIEEE